MRNYQGPLLYNVLKMVNNPFIGTKEYQHLGGKPDYDPIGPISGKKQNL